MAERRRRYPKRHFPQSVSEINAGLTPRELQIVKLICEGQSTKAIGDVLGIKFKTVVTHRTRLMQKAGVHDPISLFRWAIEEGLVVVKAESAVWYPKGATFLKRPGAPKPRVEPLTQSGVKRNLAERGFLMQDHSYKITADLLAIRNWNDGKREGVTIPSGSTVTVVDGPLNGDLLIEVSWNAESLLMFTSDVVNHGTLL